MLESTFHRLDSEKQEKIEAAVKSAILTIPAVMPREHTRWQDLPVNHQSVGSRGVNMLTSKLVLTLFPPTLPFMKLELTPVERVRLQELAGDQFVTASREVDESLLEIERQAASDFDKNGWRPAVSEAMRLLVVTGDALIYDKPGGRPSTYNLHHYCVEREPGGKLLTVVLRQPLSRQSAIEQLGSDRVSELEQKVKRTSSGHGTLETYDLYTGATLQDDGSYKYWQEFLGEPVDEPIHYAPDDLPLLPLRFVPEYETSYGRSYVQDYHGHLLSLERISRSLTEGGQALAKMVWLIKPGSTIKPNTLATAPNLAIKQGDPDDVGIVRADKGGDLGFVLNYRASIAAELQSAFLLNSSIQRNGERVTAEEIRLMAQELEDALGGVYASLADTVQSPIVMYLFRKLKREGKVKLPKQVQPVIATGLEAISRNHVATRLTQALSTLQQIVGPDRMGEILRRESVARDIMVAFNLPATKYILDDEEIAQQQQMMQQQSLVETLGPNAVNAMAQQQ